jgi:hypothetical protein
MSTTTSRETNAKMRVNQISRRPLSDHPEYPRLKIDEILHFFFPRSWVEALSDLILYMLLLVPISMTVAPPVLPFLVVLAFMSWLLGYGSLAILATVFTILTIYAILAIGFCFEKQCIRVWRYRQILMAPCLWKLQLGLERLDKVPRQLPPVLFIHNESAYQAVDLREGWVNCRDKEQSKRRLPRSKCFLPGPQDLHLLAEFKAEREAAEAALATDYYPSERH